MQSIISANNKSVTLSKMVASSNNYAPMYANEPTFPEGGIQMHSVPPMLNLGGAPANGQVTFKFPAGSGLLYEASVGFVCGTRSVITAPEINSLVAFNMVRSIEFLSGGQPIVYKTGPALLAQIKTWKNSEFQNFALKHAKMLNVDTELARGEEAAVAVAPAEHLFLTYLPLCDSFLTQVEKSLLLNVITDVQLRITFASTDESGLGGDLTSVAATLYCQTYSPKLSVLQEIIVSDWSKKLVMEWINTYTEVFPVTDVASMVLPLTVPFLVFKTHIMIKRTTPAGTLGAPLQKINSITMNLGGTTFVNNLKKSRLVSCAAKYGTSSLVSSVAGAISIDDEVMTIDWGVLTGRGQNSGTAFMQELRGSTITINYTAGVVGEMTAYVLHETFNTVAYTPGSGSLGRLEIDSNN